MYSVAQPSRDADMRWCAGKHLEIHSRDDQLEVPDGGYLGFRSGLRREQWVFGQASQIDDATLGDDRVDLLDIVDVRKGISIQ